MKTIETIITAGKEFLGLLLFPFFVLGGMVHMKNLQRDMIRTKHQPQITIEKTMLPSPTPTMEEL